MSRKWFITASTGAALLAASLLAGAATSAPAKQQRAAATITLGFSQVGSESGWRTANTKSVQSSAKTAGINLKFSDAQQKQENQIQAIRSYIQQHVNVIAFSPVVESGWDAVLNEAKRAGDPGDPHRPRGRLEGHVPLQDVHRLRLHQGRSAAGSGSPTSTRTRRATCGSWSSRARPARRRRSTARRASVQ